MRAPKNARGHFASLWLPSGGSLIPTTVTTQRKSFARAKELAKRMQLIGELQDLTGDKKYATVARQFDAVNRRWRGVKTHGPDG